MKKFIVAILAITLVAGISMAKLANFPNGISSFGVPVLGGGTLVTTGTIWFVDSVTGSNSNTGRDSTAPFASIKYTVDSRATSAKGDIIVVMPGHTETVTESIDVDQDDLRIVGIGPSAGSALVTTATANINCMDITGDDVTIENLRFTNTATMTITTEVIDVDASRTTIKNCIIDLNSRAFIDGINLATGEADNVITNNSFLLPGTAETCIKFGGKRTKIIDNNFDLSGGTGVALQQQGLAQNGYVIAYNTMSSDNTVFAMFEWLAAPGDGHSVIRNWVTNANASTEVFGSDTDLDYQFIENYNAQTDGSNTVVNPSP